MKTKISVIIPVYNVENYLKSCVESVVNQTLQDIEIILVDDESSDNCPNLCDEYAKMDKRIKVIHKMNGGLGFARNSGLEVATGEYVAFLDSDDFVDLFTYGHLYKLVKHYNLDAIYYKYKRFVNEKDVTISSPVEKIVEFKGERIKELMLDIIASEPSEKVDHKIHCSSCTAMYRMENIRNSNLRFHSEREFISEDMIFNLDYLKTAQKVAFNDGDYYHYRENPKSLTSVVRTDRFEKDLFMYNYLINNLSYWDFDLNKGKERCQRFLIGYSRTAISQILCSSIKLKKKRTWLNNVLTCSIWKELYADYNWGELPLYQRYFFKSCVKKRIHLLFLFCKIRMLLNR